jgi:hypothetical protein
MARLRQTHSAVFLKENFKRHCFCILGSAPERARTSNLMIRSHMDRRILRCQNDSDRACLFVMSIASEQSDKTPFSNVLVCVRVVGVCSGYSDVSDRAGHVFLLPAQSDSRDDPGFEGVPGIFGRCRGARGFVSATLTGCSPTRPRIKTGSVESGAWRDFQSEDLARLFFAGKNARSGSAPRCCISSKVNRP